MRSKKAIKNIFITVIQQIVSIICGFLVPQLIIRKYGSSVNGIITSITQFLSYITLLESGFGPVVKSILYKPIAQKDKNQIERILKATEKFFRKIAYIFIAYIIILCIVYPVIVNNDFDIFFSISLILIISISIFAEYFFGITYKLYLQAEQETYIISSIQIFFTIINTCLIFTLINMNFNIQIVRLISIVFVFKPLIQNFYVKRKFNINFKNTSDNFIIKQKWDGLAQHIAAVIHGNTDIVVLSIFTNMREVSVYSIYLLVINGIKNIITAFSAGIDSSFGDMIAKNEFDNLNKKYKLYEYIYHTISTIIFICTIVLIIPFVSIYTNGISDAEYVRPVFAVLIVLSEFVWAIRAPYSSIVLAVGHFKETQKGAWIEAFSNIIVSIIFVLKFGIVGVAIGTLFAMTIRTIEFMYYTSKYILKRPVINSFKWLFIISIETIGVVLLDNMIKNLFVIDSYMNLIICSVAVLLITSIIVISIHSISNKNEFKKLIILLKSMIIRKN